MYSLQSTMPSDFGILMGRTSHNSLQPQIFNGQYHINFKTMLSIIWQIYMYSLFFVNEENGICVEHSFKYTCIYAPFSALLQTHQLQCHFTVSGLWFHVTPTYKWRCTGATANIKVWYEGCMALLHGRQSVCIVIKRAQIFKGSSVAKLVLVLKKVSS